LNPIVLAIPAFFLLIGLELLFTRGRGFYRLNDSVNDLSCGILQQLVAVFLKGALFAAYLVVWDRYRLLEIPLDAPLAWGVCFVGVDFFYYWFHRASHEVNAAWAAHVVHHQSEEYNLSVALRQGSLQQLFSWPFYLPLALVGFPPAMFLALQAFNTLYQFWIHTRAIGRLGPLEWVLNTPSHHRVHHARNPEYIDRNHGGTLIVWDRLFGTFRAEEQEPVYGITRPLRSWDPLWANLHYWAELLRLARGSSRWRDRISVFFARPGWRPDELGGAVAPPPVERGVDLPWDPPVPGRVAAWVFVHFALVLVATTLYLFRLDSLGGGVRIAGALAIVVSLVSLGALLEQRRWGAGLEAARLVGLGGGLAVAVWGAAPALGTLALLLGLVAALWWLGRLAPRAGFGSPSLK